MARTAKKRKHDDAPDEDAPTMEVSVKLNPKFDVFPKELCDKVARQASDFSTKSGMVYIVVEYSTVGPDKAYYDYEFRRDPEFPEHEVKTRILGTYTSLAKANVLAMDQFLAKKKDIFEREHDREHGKEHDRGHDRGHESDHGSESEHDSESDVDSVEGDYISKEMIKHPLSFRKTGKYHDYLGEYFFPIKYGQVNWGFDTRGGILLETLQQECLTLNWQGEVDIDHKYAVWVEASEVNN